MKETNIILVPTDFTPVAEIAAKHAVAVAREINGEIHLLHVVAKQSQAEEIKPKLESIANDLASTSGIPVKSIIRVGNIFDDIGEVAAEASARLIIMGTHGVKGMQHITGSYALRVITNSSVPFIVVQENSEEHIFKNILMPLDLTKETKHKLNITANLAKVFRSKIFVIAPKEDDEFFANTIKRNLAFAKNYLEENKIPYEVKVTDEKGSFTKQVLKQAKAINADLIAIVNSPDSSGLPDIFGSGSEQQIISNEHKIPVLCMNPAKVTVSGSVLFS